MTSNWLPSFGFICRGNNKPRTHNPITTCVNVIRHTSEQIHLPDSRLAALNQLHRFLPVLGQFAANRNRVEPGHGAVSQISPALRHRLLLEEEIVTAALGRFRFSTVEKFVQEIHWRTYWKGWLELRPQVWANYCLRVAWLRNHLDPRVLERVQAVCNGASGVAIMDRFARELLATGYLHNHARMWWAGFFVHVEKLPWELGADFFFRHLLDADAASNTLSWRWVAGLQTPGKTYLPRWSNLEKYCAAEWLRDTAGWERLDDQAVTPAKVSETAALGIQTPPELPTIPAAPPGRWGLWLHEDDCALELGAVQNLRPTAIAAFSPATQVTPWAMSDLRQNHVRRVLQDGNDRAGKHFQRPVATLASSSEASLADWAVAEKLTTILAFAPFVGPVGDQLSAVRESLLQRGIALSLVRREWDAAWFPLAQAGYFPYWEKVKRRLQQNAQPEQELPLD